MAKTKSDSVQNEKIENYQVVAINTKVRRLGLFVSGSETIRISPYWKTKGTWEEVV